MIDTITTFIVISDWVNSFLIALLVLGLLINFIKKKTTGTALLFITYFFFGLSALTNSLSLYFQVMNSQFMTYAIMSVLSVILPLVGWIFFYIFSSRHILQDSEIVQGITVYTFSAYSGALFALTLAELMLFKPSQPIVIVENTISNELVRLSLSTLFLVPYIFIQIYLFFKIIYRAFVLSRKAKDKMRKRALELVVIGLVIYYFRNNIVGFAYGAENSIIVIVLWSLRLLLLMIAYICLYLGWVMPNWYKKMIREKSWFEIQYKKSLS